MRCLSAMSDISPVGELHKQRCTRLPRTDSNINMERNFDTSKFLIVKCMACITSEKQGHLVSNELHLGYCYIYTHTFICIYMHI